MNILRSIWTWFWDNIKPISNFAIVVALIFNILAFKAQRQSINLQQEAIRIDVYHRLTERIRQEKENPPEDPYKLDVWYINILNAFEDFAFYANRAYLTPEMVSFQAPYIIKECNSLFKDYPELIKKIREQGACGELRFFYRKITNKDFYNFNESGQLPK